MKVKKIVIIICIILIVAIIIIYKNKTLYELNLPNESQVKEVTLEFNKSVSYDKKENINEIINILDIKNNKTYKESLNDTPSNANEIIKLTFELLDQNIIRIYIYEKQNKYYIEQPYNGIYKINKDIYNKLLNYFN